MKTFITALLGASMLVPAAAQARKFEANGQIDAQVEAQADRPDRGERAQRPDRPDRGEAPPQRQQQPQFQQRPDRGPGEDRGPRTAVGMEARTDVGFREQRQPPPLQNGGVQQVRRDDRAGFDRGQRDDVAAPNRPPQQAELRGDRRGDRPGFRDDRRPDGRDDRRDWAQQRREPPRTNGWQGNGNRGWNDGGNRGGFDNGYGRSQVDARRDWNRGWRSDNRYDWNRYRTVNRGAYRLPRYYAPYGWGYGYRRFSIGVTLSSVLWNQSYWIDDPYAYRLPEAYGPYRWVRYYDDALLVDIRTGRVVDTVYGIFW